MTTDPTEQLQVGVWRVLKTDPVVSALANAVLDAEPEHQSFPYVVVDSTVAVDDSTHDRPGRQIDIAVHTWVKGEVRGRNERPDNRIGSRVVELFDRNHRFVDTLVQDHTVWFVRVLDSRRVPDTDRSLRHRVDTIRIRTSQDAV